MATYTDKFCPTCKALAFKCKCGANPARRAPARTRPFVQRQANPTPAPAAPAPVAPAAPVVSRASELAKVTLDQIPGEPPADNKGGRLNVYVKARREVYSYFIQELTKS